MSANWISKTKVGKAGEALTSPLSSSGDRATALEVVNYRRGIHAEALQRAFGDIEGLNAVGSDVLIAGRIKKLPTIVDKLGRPDAPSDLQTMYDIAGCRLVVPDLATLERVYSEIACLPTFDAPKTKRHDYIAYPRPSGYRGKHAILHYCDLKCGHKLFVEVQLRTVLQHAWATAVEMHDVAVKSRLKFNEIDNPAGRFFKKAAVLIAQLEEQGEIDASAIRGLADGRPELSYAIEAKETLKAASNAVYFLSDDANRDVADYYLVDLVADEQTLELTPLDSIAALSRYFEEEGADRDGSRDLVLTKGASKENLAKLYPNYFGDISEFLKLIEKHLDAFA